VARTVQPAANEQAPAGARVSLSFGAA